VSAQATSVRGLFSRYGVRLLRTYGVVLALVLVVILVASQSSAFLTWTNITNLSGQWAAAGIIAVGMTYVIICGGLDLSVGASFSFCAITAAQVAQTTAPEVAFLAAIGVGLVIGTINGLVVTLLKVNSLIATLGTGLILAGLGLVWTDNAPIAVTDEGFARLGQEVAGIPYSGILLVLFLVLGGIVLARTVYGQWVYATGGNLEAASLTGLPTRLVTASTYTFTGLCAGVAGVIAASQLGAAQADFDPDLLFDVITIVVLGGTSLTGGFGAMWRTAVGVAIIATLDNGFNLLNLDPNFQDIFKGAILIGALALDSYAQRLARAREG
jgi:ribose transport system permease protein